MRACGKGVQRMQRKNKIRQSLGSQAMDAVILIIVTLLTIICAYPMIYVLMASFSDPIRLMNNRQPIFWPLGWSLGGYEIVIRNPTIWLGYRNTLVYVVGGTALNMFMTILGAYALSRPNFAGKKFFSIFIVFTMYFNGGLIPNYLLMKNLHMLNTMWALIIPGAIGTWNMLILRTAFKGVPASLEEAAIIDGANDFVVILRVLLPVSMASIAVITLFYAVGHWNAWFNAMVYLPRARQLYPLQLFLREILIASTTVEESTELDFSAELVKYCTIIVSTIPILCLYPFLQKYFVKGIMIGSIKG